MSNLKICALALFICFSLKTPTQLEYAQVLQEIRDLEMEKRYAIGHMTKQDLEDLNEKIMVKYDRVTRLEWRMK